jgi:hypothetical protein
MDFTMENSNLDASMDLPGHVFEKLFAFVKLFLQTSLCGAFGSPSPSALGSLGMEFARLG